MFFFSNGFSLDYISLSKVRNYRFSAKLSLFKTVVTSQVTGFSYLLGRVFLRILVMNQHRGLQYLAHGYFVNLRRFKIDFYITIDVFSPRFTILCTIFSEISTRGTIWYPPQRFLN